MLPIEGAEDSASEPKVVDEAALGQVLAVVGLQRGQDDDHQRGQVLEGVG